jgi:transketolase
MNPCYPYKRLLDICYNHQLHHLSSYFSSLHIIDDIYSKMNKDDIFILSNGHAVVSLYVILEKYFNIDAEELLSKYGEHPKRDDFNKIYCSTGSLGMGLTVAVGRALLNNNDVYCLISDGECAEGSIWEALRFANDNNLHNLKIHLNANGYSGYGPVDINYLKKRIHAFHPLVEFHDTTFEWFNFKGIDGHYKQLTADQYKTAVESL